MIVDVAFEDGSVSLCRVLHSLNELEYLVEEFVCYRDGTCKFNGETQSISREAVCGYYDVTDVEDTGLYRKVTDGIYEPIYDSDEDYEMSSDEESDSDISLDEEE
tara:strand:+ start:135 stop:449 length:315 start_codon:yes stop_codon:yes gene_type:complete